MSSKKIKVMHFVSGLVSGGVEEMLYNYCKFMDHEKYEFIIVYQHEPVKSCIEKIESAYCKTIRITARNENFLKNIKDSINLIKKEKPDIVHAHMNLMNFCALYAAKKNDISVRISHSHIAEKNRGLIFNVFASVCKFLCVKYATTMYSCGKEAGLYLYGKKRMQNNEVTIIENAVDLDYFKIDKTLGANFKKLHGIENKFVVGHIGRFTFQKNHDRLIQIFNALLKYKPNAVLLLVGTGELFDEIKTKVDNSGLSNKVLFLGTTSNMKEVYSAMDVFVLPSRFEGFPVVSMEVQAANLPAVFSDTIAKTCKVTDSICFFSLNESNDEWAKAIIKHYEDFQESDLSELKKMYDIRTKALELDNKYQNLLAGR